MSGDLGRWALGDLAPPDLQRGMFLDLLAYLLDWHCTLPTKEPFPEESLFRLSHSVLALCCCKGVRRKLQAVMQSNSFSVWIMRTFRTSGKQAVLLQTICADSVYGDHTVVVSLGDMDRLMRPWDTLLCGHDLPQCLYLSYYPDSRSSATDGPGLSLALGVYGWYSKLWAVGADPRGYVARRKRVPHPLGRGSFKRMMSGALWLRYV